MKKVLIGFTVFIALLLIGFFVSPDYLQKALIYQKPNIDDYKIFANRNIEAGNYIPWDSAADYNKKKLSAETLAKMETFDPVAFLIMQKGKLKYEKYWQNYNSDSLSNSFSMAKSIISLLIGIATDDGFIKSVDQPVSDFFPEFKSDNKTKLTIKHLLTMSSGLNWDESYSSPFSLTTEAYYGNDIKSLISNLQIIDEPGINYKYLSGNTQLLAMILEKATGEKVADYTSKKLWKPLGAKNMAKWSLDSLNGMEKAYCCFNSNARDFARIGQMILNSGMFDDVHVVSKSYLDSATKAADNLKNSSGKPVDFYGYQFWIANYLDYKIPFARGILGQYIYIIPAKNAVVVRLGHERSEERTIHPQMPDDIFLYLEAAMEILD